MAIVLLLRQTHTYKGKSMLKVMNKLVLGEGSKCKQTAMVRLRTCDKTGEMSHSCVMCVPVDSTDMGYQSPGVKKQATVSLQ